MDRFAGDPPCEHDALGLADTDRRFARVKAVGTVLRDAAMVDVVILGAPA